MFILYAEGQRIGWGTFFIQSVILVSEVFFYVRLSSVRFSLKSVFKNIIVRYVFSNAINIIHPNI